MKITLLGVLLISLSTLPKAQNTKSHYKIAGKINLEGDAGWDYLTADEETNRLYVSHGAMVQVVDLNTGKLAGTIPNTNGVHGIALAQDLNKGFISDGKDTAVTIFDLKTFAILAKIKVTGNNPDAIQYDKVTQRVFTFNGKSSNSTVIDAKTNAVIGSITLDGKPEFSAADGTGKIFVNIEDKSSISEIDAKSMKVLHTWSVSPGEEPSGLTMDKKNRRLFAVCGNKLMVVMNADNGKVITTVPIGEKVDGDAFDPAPQPPIGGEGGCAYSSNGEGTLTVVKEETPDKFIVLENVTTQKGARTIAVNTKTHHIYMPTADFLPPQPAKAEGDKPRPKIKPGTFVVLDIVPVD